MAHLRLACLNIDGVLLPDTFSPVFRRLLAKHGAPYTAELERLLLSQPRLVAGSILAAAVRQPWTWQDAEREYFRERTEYLAEHPIVVADGLAELLELLRDREIPAVCYGGLARGHFDEHLGAHAAAFADYVCTDEIRPGISEIVARFGVRPDQALFVDDVNRFAEFARALGVAFVGMPNPDSFQPAHMRETGVRHLVGSLTELTGELLDVLDAEAAAGTVWR